jgi:UDPglucose 6-dehydrogenase
MKISMIGCGKLGLPCAEVMNTHYDVVGYDVNPIVNAEFQIVDSIKEAVVDRDIVFIAVPTPHDPAYSGNSPIVDLPPKDFDYSIVKNVLLEVNKYATKNQLVVLISTVLPGTVRTQLIGCIDNARFIYNPYLIAMGSVKWDMINPECLIIGTEDGTTTGDAKILIDFYKPLMVNDPKVNVGTWDEAEAIKIFYNTFISTKISLVNMIQDVAEKNGNINVDVVTTALGNSDLRITSKKYMTAGMGDAGACHPRDNIALRYLAQRLDLGYDLFYAVMYSRDKQAENMANKLVQLAREHGLPIVIHGKAYKPNVPYTDGSYSDLVGYYVQRQGYNVLYADPLTGHTVLDNTVAVVLLAHNASVTYQGTGVDIGESKFYYEFGKGSVIVDPWRTTHPIDGMKVIHYGNTRKS